MTYGIAPEWLYVGALVDLSRWDSTEHPEKRRGSPCRVTAVRARARGCGSGVMVDFETPAGKQVKNMDSAWLKPYSPR